MHFIAQKVVPIFILLIGTPVISLPTGGNSEDLSCVLWSRSGVPVKGLLSQSYRTDNPVDYCSFYRIPYARPPIKKFRFQKAQLMRLFGSKPKSLDLRPSTPECTQERRGELVGQEDCLFLNVFTTRGLGHNSTTNNKSNLQPVVVWIHGGTFALGSGLSDGFNAGALIEEDIVVVSFNYRLDLYGFIPVSPDEPYSMNLGLSDQKVALKWVRKHIKLFGGDPDRVTIMGWSAGSASVNYLLYDAEAKGLFHAAIAMSGSFLSPWAFCNYPFRRRQLMCDALWVKECTLNGMLSALGANFKNLARLDYMYMREIMTVVWGTSFPLFSPAPQYPGDSPELRMRMGPVNDVPLMVGVTNDEAKDFQLGSQIHGDQQANYVFANDDPKVLDSVVQMLRSVESQSKDQFNEHLAMADLYYGVYKFLELHSRRTKKSVFVYRFHYNPRNGSTIAAAHGADIHTLFRSFDDQIPDNRKMNRMMTKLWSNFIKNQ